MVTPAERLCSFRFHRLEIDGIYQGPPKTLTTLVHMFENSNGESQKRLDREESAPKLPYPQSQPLGSSCVALILGVGRYCTPIKIGKAKSVSR